MKTLSQLLEDYRPSRIKCSNTVEHTTFEEYYKLRSVAIELAKACETTAIMDNDCGRWCKRSLSRAKDIIGDSNG